MRVAALYDVHAMPWALEAVLGRGRRRGRDRLRRRLPLRPVPARDGRDASARSTRRCCAGNCEDLAEEWDRAGSGRIPRSTGEHRPCRSSLVDRGEDGFEIASASRGRPVQGGDPDHGGVGDLRPRERREGPARSSLAPACAGRARCGPPLDHLADIVRRASHQHERLVALFRLDTNRIRLVDGRREVHEPLRPSTSMPELLISFATASVGCAPFPSQSFTSASSSSMIDGSVCGL